MCLGCTNVNKACWKVEAERLAVVSEKIAKSLYALCYGWVFSSSEAAATPHHYTTVPALY